MDMNFDVNKVLQNRLAESMGLDSYQFIVNQVRKNNVSTDAHFQRTFNGFYMVRRNETWRKVYYEYFEQAKTRFPTFADILIHMYERTGNVEPSFSSKMLATICPQKPIWDRYVLQNLNMQLEGSTAQQKLENAISLYADIEKWYENFLQTAKAQECIDAFDRALPDYKWVSSIKKIDCFLWSIR